MLPRIDADIVCGHSQCVYKSYLLLCTGREGTPHELDDILNDRRLMQRSRVLAHAKEQNPHASEYAPEGMNKGVPVLLAPSLDSDGLHAECELLTRVAGRSRLGRYSYEPTICVGTERISDNDKLRLYFVAYILEKLQGRRPDKGQIVNVRGKRQRVSLKESASRVRPILEVLKGWAKHQGRRAIRMGVDRRSPLAV